MRDFRDAKAMARSLRAALAAKGFKITVSQSLELIAHAFGAADWNTLAAAIRRDADYPQKHLPAAARNRRKGSSAVFRGGLRSTLRRALDCAIQRKHE